MKHNPRVIVVGSVAYDEIMTFPSYFKTHLHAESLHNINVSFVVDHLEKEFGGTATNIAYNLSCVGVTEIHILAGVGKDADPLLSFYHQNGIKTDGILRDERLYTATGKVITDKDGNQIWGFYYGACEKGEKIDISDFVTPSDILILSATHPKPFLKAQKQAIENKYRYLYDPGMALTYLSGEDLLEGVKHCTWLVGNEYEINHITKTLSLDEQELIKEYDMAVITTKAEKGVTYQDSKQTLNIPSCPNIKMIDPTGAGDAWRAGFISGICDDESIEICLKRGNVLASFAIEHIGNVHHRPTKEEINMRIEMISSPQ